MVLQGVDQLAPSAYVVLHSVYVVFLSVDVVLRFTFLGVVVDGRHDTPNSPRSVPEALHGGRNQRE